MGVDAPYFPINLKCLKISKIFWCTSRHFMFTHKVSRENDTFRPSVKWHFLCSKIAIYMTFLCLFTHAKNNVFYFQILLGEHITLKYFFLFYFVIWNALKMHFIIMSLVLWDKTPWINPIFLLNCSFYSEIKQLQLNLQSYTCCTVGLWSLN
jgi:hypothetical protein